MSLTTLQMTTRIKNDLDHLTYLIDHGGTDPQDPDLIETHTKIDAIQEYIDSGCPGSPASGKPTLQTLFHYFRENFSRGILLLQGGPVTSPEGARLIQACIDFLQNYVPSTS